MAATTLDWTAAEEEARAVAQAWDAEAGPGGAIVLLDRDGGRPTFGGGLASLDRPLPFTADTACRFASVSKHFFCALLAHDGSIGFDDRLGAHLKLPDAIGAVTVGRALDMTAGIPDAMETFWLLGVPPTTALDRHELLRFVSRFGATNFPPGTEISYSNSGYRLVQAAFERDGRDYFDALHSAFFAPLGVSIRLPEDWSDPVPNLATGYWRDGSRWRSGQYGMHLSASGGLAGTARDLASWLTALLAGRGPVAGLLEVLTAERRLTDGRTTAYGLGIARQRLGGHEFVGHGGSLPGYKTHFLLSPASGTGVVLVSNREDTLAATTCLRILAAALGLRLPPAAIDTLPIGMFVSDDGRFWLETTPGSATFLGAQEQMFDLGDGAATGLSAHLPMRLTRDGDGIAGEIGHVTRRFRPAETAATVKSAWSGIWAIPGENARFEIAGDTFRGGVGPLQNTAKLHPIGPDLALMTHGDRGPWRQRVCLRFGPGEAKLTTNRSRVLSAQLEKRD